MPCPGMRNRWPCGVPGGTLSTTRLPSSARTLIFEPPSAGARLTGPTPMTSSPSRRKKRSGSTWIATTTSPRPLAPCPLSRSRAPSSVPAGIVIASRFSTRTSPDPWQVGHGCAGTRPRPRHTGHGRVTANPPWPNEIVPRPLHSGHVEKVVPGAPPDPLQVGHTSGSVSVTGTRPPSAATRNGIETAVSISSSSSARGPPPRRPKIDENRSPSPPNEPRSERSNSTPPPPRPPPDHPRRPDQGTAHLIARLQHRPHRVILGGMVRGLSRDGLVQVGIERHAALIHPRHPGGFQLFPQLALHRVHAVVDRLRVGLRRV